MASMPQDDDDDKDDASDDASDDVSDGANDDAAEGVADLLRLLLCATAAARTLLALSTSSRMEDLVLSVGAAFSESFSASRVSICFLFFVFTGTIFMVRLPTGFFLDAMGALRVLTTGLRVFFRPFVATALCWFLMSIVLVANVAAIDLLQAARILLAFSTSSRMEDLVLSVGAAV